MKRRTLLLSLLLVTVAVIFFLSPGFFGPSAPSAPPGVQVLGYGSSTEGRHVVRFRLTNMPPDGNGGMLILIYKAFPPSGNKFDFPPRAIQWPEIVTNKCALNVSIPDRAKTISFDCLVLRPTPLLSRLAARLMKTVHLSPPPSLNRIRSARTSIEVAIPPDTDFSKPIITNVLIQLPVLRPPRSRAPQYQDPIPGITNLGKMIL